MLNMVLESSLHCGQGLKITSSKLSSVFWKEENHMPRGLSLTQQGKGPCWLCFRCGSDCFPRALPPNSSHPSWPWPHHHSPQKHKEERGWSDTVANILSSLSCSHSHFCVVCAYTCTVCVYSKLRNSHAQLQSQSHVWSGGLAGSCN